MKKTISKINRIVNTGANLKKNLALLETQEEKKKC